MDKANLNNVSNTEAIEKLKKMEENSLKFMKLRADGDEIYNKVKREDSADTLGVGQNAAFFVLVAIFAVIVLEFQLSMTAVGIGIVVCAVIASLLGRGAKKNKQQRIEYEARLKEAEAEKDRLYKEAGRLYSENLHTLHIPSSCSSPKGLRTIRMLLESGQANNLDVAIYMCEKDVAHEKTLMQMQNQINQLQNDVDDANRRAEEAERYAKYRY